jgi:hypothetical protein
MAEEKLKYFVDEIQPSKLVRLPLISGLAT